jgi:MFS family permease
MKKEERFPAWLVVLAGTQFGALFVFMNFSGALPLLQNEWQLTNGQAGAIQSAGQVGYLLSVLALSSLTDYIKSKNIIICGAIWSGVWNLVFVALAHDTTSAVILRAMIGFGIAGIYMPGVKLISQQIHSSKRGSALGFFVASFTLGTAVSIIIGGNLSATLGWQTAFSITSIGPLIGALVSWRLLPDENEIIQKEKETYSLFEILKNRTVMLVILLYVAHAWEVLGLRNWLSAYLTAAKVNAGFSLKEATISGSSAAGFAIIAAALATASVAAISDRFSRTKTIIIVLLVGFFSVFGLGFTLNSAWGIIVIVSLIASFLSNADSAVISTALTEVVPSRYLGRTLAIYSFFGFLAGSISPYVFGKTLDIAIAIGADKGNPADTPWRWAFFTLAIGSLFGMIIALLLHRRLSAQHSDDKSKY